MKSSVRVLPAAAYTFNTVPIYDPGGPNPHGRVWETFPVPVGDFTPRSHYPSEAGLPKPDSDPAPDSLGIGLSPNSSQKYTVLFLEPIRSLIDPFRVSHTIIGTSDDREGYRGQYPPLRLYLGPDGRLALKPVIRATNWSPNDMGMYVYISQRKYIPYLTSIHALSPYELSHTIIPVTCVYNGFNNGINHFICTSSFIIS